MLTYFRNRRSSILLYFITGLVCIVMLSFGVVLRQYRPQESWILKIEGKKIPLKYYVASYQQTASYFQSLMQGQFDPKMLNLFPIHSMVIETLKERELLETMTSHIKLVYSPEFVKEKILEQDVFRENNQFSFDRYKNFLARGTTLSPITPKKYEAYVGQNFLVQTMDRAIKGSFILTSNYKKALDQLRETEYKVRAYPLKAENIQSPISIEPAELEHFASDPKNHTLIQNAYFKNIDRYRKKDQFQAKHILFALPAQADATKDTEAKTKADSIYDQLQKEPKKFEELAKQHSEDPGSKAKGGDLGTFGAGDMVKGFEDQLKALKPDEISKPFKSQFGYHIAKLISYQPGSTQELDTAKTELAKEILTTQKKEALINTYQSVLQTHFKDRNHPEIARILSKTLSIKSEETTFFSPYQTEVSPMGNAFDLRKHLKHHGTEYKKDDFITEVIQSQGVPYVVQFVEKRKAFSEGDPTTENAPDQFAAQIESKWQDYVFTQFKEGLGTLFKVEVNEKALAALKDQGPAQDY